MHEARTPQSQTDREALELWHDLSRVYSRAASMGGRSARLGFTATLISGALVLLSVPLLGAGWASPLVAVAIPAALGLVSGLGMYGRERWLFRRREDTIAKALAERGLDAERPGVCGGAAYYDPQLVLIRCEYEYLRQMGARRGMRLVEDSFGFTPEDPFEAGPLNVSPDSEDMSELRERWTRRAARRRERAPALGLREEVAYRVFPREMTVGTERVFREGYLSISLDLARIKYGKNYASAPEELRPKIEREAEEYFRLTGKRSG